MMSIRRGLQALTASVTLAALLAACGGGGDPVRSVRVMGDSLADVGTFGLKFTIQGQDIYPERVGEAYGLGKGCNFFAFTGTTFVPNSKPGCTNYAIGGGVINPASSGLTAADPRGLGVQFAAATAGGNFNRGDLLLIDGGGNDAAGLVGAYLKAATDGGAAYVALLGTQLTQAQVGAAVAGGQNGLANAGGQYMTALANTFANMIQAQLIDKGAERIVLVNMPAITLTPRFQAVLDQIAQVSGPGATGAAARTQAETLFNAWVAAFNTQLAARFNGNAKVAIVDLYGEFKAWVAEPAKYGLTDARRTACPITGTGSDGLPSYTFATCTATALAATPPSGATGSDWFNGWLFSDSFHPTGKGHALATQSILSTLRAAGWL